MLEAGALACKVGAGVEEGGGSSDMSLASTCSVPKNVYGLVDGGSGGNGFGAGARVGEGVLSVACGG